MHYSELATQLRERRETLRITQETLSELSGVAIRTLKQIEKGEGNPTLGTMERIATVLGMEVTIQVINK
jgi:transcriptional regulator with XRE-family HTH domain